MRLIDADAITGSKELAKKIVSINLTPYIKVDDLLEFIDNLPTAFDKEKVMAELEEEREYAYADFEEYANSYELDLSDDDDYYHIGLERAIKLVRKGGVE